MKRIILSVLMVFSFTGYIFSQEVDFTADRPGASTGPFAVGQNVIQFEQGIQYDGDGYKGSFTFSNTLLRYGIFDGMELRFGGYAFIYDNNDKWKVAFSGISIGTKIKCFEGHGVVPAVSVLADFSIPNTGTNGFTVNNLAPSLYLLFENPLNKN